MQEDPMTPSMHEGGCLCGAVRYRASGAPRALTLCHCRSCRRASGAPSVAWAVFNAGDFEFTTGEPARFQSSPSVERTFCAQCGTPLTYQQQTRADSIDVTTVSLDEPDRFAPEFEIWVEHKIAWETLDPKLPHYPRSSKRDS
jgi:hypothetical protein